MTSTDFCNDTDTLAQLESWEAFFSYAEYQRLSTEDALTAILNGTAPADSNEAHSDLMPEDLDLVLMWSHESADSKLHALATRCEAMAVTYNAAERLAEERGELEFLQGA